jgi:hypothetical protein
MEPEMQAFRISGFTRFLIEHGFPVNEKLLPAE